MILFYLSYLLTDITNDIGVGKDCVQGEKHEIQRLSTDIGLENLFQLSHSHVIFKDSQMLNQ